MARITIEDCQERISNRFLLVQMAIKRVHQFRQGYEPLINTKNKECVTALREIAAGKILPENLDYYIPVREDEDLQKNLIDD
jgi:DNA-directed RNA polymerase subunit omega